MNPDLLCTTEEAIKDFMKDDVASNLGLINNLEEIHYSLFVEANEAFLVEDVLSETIIDESVCEHWMWDETCCFMDSFSAETMEHRSEAHCIEDDVSSDENEVSSLGCTTEEESEQSLTSPESCDSTDAGDWTVVEDKNSSDAYDDWVIIPDSDVTKCRSDEWIVLSQSTTPVESSSFGLFAFTRILTTILS